MSNVKVHQREIEMVETAVDYEDVQLEIVIYLEALNLRVNKVKEMYFTNCKEEAVDLQCKAICLLKPKSKARGSPELSCTMEVHIDIDNEYHAVEMEEMSL